MLGERWKRLIEGALQTIWADIQVVTGTVLFQNFAWQRPSNSAVASVEPSALTSNQQIDLVDASGVMVLADGTSTDPTKFLRATATPGLCTYETPPSVAGSIPAGLICMWSGTIATIPGGWALCDGTAGTPDLRDKFIVGARQDDAGVAKTNVTGALTATGGAATHDHAFGTLAVADHASHTHTYTEVPNHTHPVNITDPGHSHVETQNSATTGGLTGWAARDTSTNTQSATGYSTESSTTGITATTSNPTGGVATGTTNGPSATLSHSVSGATAAGSTLPPYYALAFIMKT
jgi:hypothetical protein